MRIVLLIVVILVIAVAVYAAAAVPAKCPECGKPIKEGHDVALKIIKGIPQPVHFEHAFDRAMKNKLR